MLMQQVFRWLLFGAEMIVALPILYLCIVSVSAILATKKCKNNPSPSSTRPSLTNFAILIPAHNEISILDKLLESLAALDYPKDKFTVFVVADNCTDATADLARATGWVNVYERFDQEKRGKGYALNWLLQQLKQDRLNYDAYVFLDADSVVDPTLLLTMNDRLLQGARALQARYTVLNATDSPGTALRWIALSLINHVRPLGRNGIGASATLAGNGMCFTHNLLEQYPWQAFSLTEDYQYYLRLILYGERVLYVPDAVVRSVMPTQFKEMQTQDIRWEANTGNESSWKTAWRLLKAGLKFGDFVRLEAIAELLTPPLSLLASSCLLSLAGSLALQSPPHVLVGLFLTGGLLFYINSALYLLRPPRAIYRALLHAPRFILWKLRVLFVLRRSKKYTSEWIRTNRTAS
jgi:cellulose synthase/poly-beta-1,6-N-acetylglucosamine synthase-like glycosyltransferase